MEQCIHDPDLGQFRVYLEQQMYAVARYYWESDLLNNDHQDPKVMAITSTRVPDELQGKGYGKVLMEAILPEIEQMGVVIRPVCPYVEHYLNRHPQWQHLLA